MMFEKIIRSPLSMMFFVLLFGVLIYSRFYSPEFLAPYTDWITITSLIIIAIYFAIITHHNRKNPDRKISFFGWIPYEMKEEDEGKQWVTFQACRKVYIFYSFALPASILVLVLIDSFPGLPVLILLFLAVCQYGIFWWEERKYNQHEAEDDF